LDRGLGGGVDRFGRLGDATHARRCFDDLGFGHDRGFLRARGFVGLRRLGGLGGLFGLDLSTQTVSVRATSDAVGLGVLDRRRGARGTYAECLGERE
jgi:hypothetical protein